MFSTAMVVPAEQWFSAAAFLALLLYLAGSARLRWRGDAWPVGRVVSFVAGCTAAMVATSGQLPGGAFTAHMLAHVLLGMAGPLLLIAGRPVTLALRALPAGHARRTVLRVVHSRLATTVAFPPVAATADIGGLWLLYRSPLLAAGETRPWLQSVVHLHIFASGVLFIAAICQIEPTRHRYSFRLRAVVLVAAGAAHGILAKSLWIAAPPQMDLPTWDVRLGAEIMYYAGDVIEIALALLLCLQWYAESGRRIRGQPNSRCARSGPAYVGSTTRR